MPLPFIIIKKRSTTLYNLTLNELFCRQIPIWQKIHLKEQ